MKIPIFMIFQFFGIISSWAVKALEDGKVTAQEGLELVEALAGLLGVKIEFDVKDYMPAAPKPVVAPTSKNEEAGFLSEPDYTGPDKKPGD